LRRYIKDIEYDLSPVAMQVTSDAEAASARLEADWTKLFNDQDAALSA
jgi:hypothetical protein